MSYRISVPNMSSQIFLFLLTLIYMLSLNCSQALYANVSTITKDNTNLKTYIVHVKFPNTIKDKNSVPLEELESFYHSFLPPTIASSDRRTRMVHCYRHVITGFAARLSEEEVKSMEKRDWFISATPEEFHSLYTTRSQAFMGLLPNTGLWRDSNYGKGIIIGVLDSGVALNHPSFDDVNMPPPPPRWKGRCALGKHCNNKLIGTWTAFRGETAEDRDSHGTHVASIAAGNSVSGASVFGQATGDANGSAPGAHLAIYKVCSNNYCPETAILAGMEKAMDDGVDVINLSLGSRRKSNFFTDYAAIGSFAATRRGIFVSCAGGNSGPDSGTLSNQAPWVLTVGASSTDRSIRATAVLGNGAHIEGESLRQIKLPPTLLPLIYPGEQLGTQEAARCDKHALNTTNVQGKVVVCDQANRSYEGLGYLQGKNVLDAGAAAMILVNQQKDGYTISAEAHVLPTIDVAYRDGNTIKSYIISTRSPQATILFNGTVYREHYAPEVASFSSRGPNTVSPGILKPDIIGPGSNILAAWPFLVGDTTKTRFNIISGTSMASSHLCGIAALLKATHPTWSPAAIKSAIMTTATVLSTDGIPITDQNKKEANWYDLGAGHVLPSSANDPGLVYDIQTMEYIWYLCGLKYRDQEVSRIVDRPIRCVTLPDIPEAQLNYPTFSVTLDPGTSKRYFRTVTNVGDADSSYNVSVNMPPSVSLVVQPPTLSFTRVNQKMSYLVTFRRNVSTGSMVVHGYLTWSSTRHIVRSQISVVLR